MNRKDLQKFVDACAAAGLVLGEMEASYRAAINAQADPEKIERIVRIIETFEELLDATSKVVPVLLSEVARANTDYVELINFNRKSEKRSTETDLSTKP